MRLIDVDKLPRHGGRGGIVHWTDIEKAPTVKAIPIEFIMRKCEILREMQLTCSDFDDESLWKSYMDEEHYLNLLMMTWAERKEE